MCHVFCGLAPSCLDAPRSTPGAFGSAPGALPEQKATLGAWPSVPFFVSGSLRERSGSNHVSPSKSGGCP